MTAGSVGRSARLGPGLALGLVALVAACGPTKTLAQQAADLLSAGIRAQNAGRTAEATTDYRKVLDLDPHNKYAYYDLGTLDQEAGRTTDAESRYRSALAIDPNMEPTLFNLAILRTPVDATEAEQLYRHVIQVDPRNAAAHLNLGFLLRGVGRGPEANAEFALATSIDPSLAGRIASASPSPSPSPSRAPATASPKP